MPILWDNELTIKYITESKKEKINHPKGPKGEDWWRGSTKFFSDGLLKPPEINLYWWVCGSPNASTPSVLNATASAILDGTEQRIYTPARSLWTLLLKIHIIL